MSGVACSEYLPHTLPLPSLSRTPLFSLSLSQPQPLPLFTLSLSLSIPLCRKPGPRTLRTTICLIHQRNMSDSGVANDAQAMHRQGVQQQTTWIFGQLTPACGRHRRESRSSGGLASLQGRHYCGPMRVSEPKTHHVSSIVFPA